MKIHKFDILDYMQPNYSVHLANETETENFANRDGVGNEEVMENAGNCPSGQSNGGTTDGWPNPTSG